jgi:hypothetical protein
MRHGLKKTIAVLLVPVLLLFACPLVCNAGDFSDNSSEGAAITLGLFVTMIAVLFLVSFKTDVDKVFSKSKEQAPLRRDDSLAKNITLVLEPPRSSPTEHNLGQASELELANGLNVGVRVRF